MKCYMIILTTSEMLSGGQESMTTMGEKRKVKFKKQLSWFKTKPNPWPWRTTGTTGKTKHGVNSRQLDELLTFQYDHGGVQGEYP